MGCIKGEVHGLTRAYFSFGWPLTKRLNSLIRRRVNKEKKRAALIASCEAPHLESVRVLSRIRVNILNEAGKLVNEDTNQRLVTCT